MAINTSLHATIDRAQRSFAQLTVNTLRWQRAPEPSVAATLPDRGATEQLINSTLNDIDQLIIRVEREMPRKDPTRNSQLLRFKAYQKVLKNYTHGTTDIIEARNYAECARSQLQCLRATLDRNARAHAQRITRVPLRNHPK